MSSREPSGLDRMACCILACSGSVAADLPVCCCGACWDAWGRLPSTIRSWSCTLLAAMV